MTGIISGVAAIIVALMWTAWISVGILALPFLDPPSWYDVALVYLPGVLFAAAGAAMIVWR